jgi:hypothetical protein
MPALPSPGKVLRVDKFYQLSEDIKAKVGGFHLYTAAPPTSAILDTLAASLQIALATDTGALLNGLWKMTEIIITDLSSSLGAQGSSSVVNNGSRAGTFTDAAACVLEHETVARRYRGGHPRAYWPFGVAEDLQDGQTWKAAFVAACQAALTTWATDIQTDIAAVLGDGRGVNVSYYHGSTPFTGPTGRVRNISTPRVTPLVDLLTGSTVKTGVANQRRRLLRLA